MSKSIESLVPPLDLCKQIPEGAFVDSALVYIAGGIVVPRYIKLGDTEHFNNGTPAPTLAEIMKDIEILIMDNFSSPAVGPSLLKKVKNISGSRISVPRSPRSCCGST